jgi:hypothetical protein
VVFLISSITSSILGSAVDSWFAKTKAGTWFYKKVDENWKKKHPHVNQKIDELEAKINKLEKGD